MASGDASAAEAKAVPGNDEGLVEEQEVSDLHFTVASRLFEELGDKLVGSPALALAELVKNSFDADASYVQIHLRPSGSNSIRVLDDGHGMTLDQFRRFWARVGDDHKQEAGRSPYLERPYTGSKGVGRIAAELLSRYLEVRTTSIEDPKCRLVVKLDWKEAIATGDLIDVQLGASIQRFDTSQPIGTEIILDGLRTEWTDQAVDELAHELWRLEPPFRKRRIHPRSSRPLPPFSWSKVPEKDKQTYRDPADFSIYFEADDASHRDRFEETRLRLFTLHDARIVGKIADGQPHVEILFEDGDQYQSNFEGLERTGPAKIYDARFEIRVYELKGRQKGNLKVNEVRDYLRRYGGVQIFDGGFRLSHYGSRENDWLLITEDHARRLSESPLLPDDLQIPLGMHYMPTYYKVYGSVEIHTGLEPNLDISITRDRLLPSPAFDSLQEVIRASLHWYGMLRMMRMPQSPGEQTPSRSVATVSHLIEEYKSDIPSPVYKELKRASKVADRVIAEDERSTASKTAVLGAYATAGIASMAYHHEVDKQLFELESIADEIHDRAREESAQWALFIRDRIRAWAMHARQLKALFSPVSTAENREVERLYSVRELVHQCLDQLAIPLREVVVEEKIEETLTFPPATYMEWASILQNVLFNAINALENSPDPQILIQGATEDHFGRLRVMDNGSGLDLGQQSKYFEAFNREGPPDPMKMMRGYGGAGLGLYIVKTIASRRRCTARFEPPTKPYRTSFVLDWKLERPK